MSKTKSAEGEIPKTKPGTFQKGDPRINRNGRPLKGESLTEILNSVMDEDIPLADGKLINSKVALARKLRHVAIVGGDVAAMKYIYDRSDGRPREAIDLIARVSGVIGQMTEEERNSFDENFAALFPDLKAKVVDDE
jgi:hypothetical protein